MTAAVRPTPRVDLGRLLGASRIIHPFPTALNVAATVGLATIANEGVPGASVVVRLALAMFFAQAAIGATNDYCDRDLDPIAKPNKPIARGLVTPGTALVLGAAFVATACALTATFGPLSVAAGAIGLAAGLAYNIRLKRTVLSALPLMVALPTLPIWIWLSLDRFTSELWWLLPFAPLAALAVHLSNALPDLEGDARGGVHALASTLGRRRSIALAWGSFALALALASALGPYLDYDWSRFLFGAVPATALLTGAVVAYLRRPGRDALQLGFGLIGIATAALAAGWLAAIRT